MMEEDLVLHLKNTLPAAVLASIQHVEGAVTITRIFPVLIPQGSPLPVITYQRISSPEVDNLENGSSGLVYARVQLGHWSGLPSETHSLAKAVRTALIGHQFGVAKATRVLDARDRNWEPDPKVFGFDLDVEVWFQE